MALPLDVVDHILGFLQSDPKSLKTCSQSHPVFSKLAERHLYSSITIIANGGGDVVANENRIRKHKLSKILSNNPHIANYVRSLKVDFECYPSRHHPTANLERVLAVVPQFLSLRKLTINHARNDMNASWDIVETSACPAFLALFQSMEEVNLENLDLNSSCLRRCQTIGSLTLRGCSFYSMDASKSAPLSSPQPLLKSLSIENCSNISLQKFLAWVQTLPLLSLRLLGHRLHSFLPQLLSGCSSSLYNLDLDFKFRTEYRFTMDDREDPPGSRVLSFTNVLALPRLEGLVFHAKMDFHQRELPEGVHIWTLFAPLPEMLQLVKSSPSLKHLCLDLRYCLWGNIYTANDLPRADHIWFPLLSLATECVARSTKIYAFVRWDMQGGHTYPPDLISTSIADCGRLMQLVEQGVVVIKSKVGSGAGYQEEEVDGLPIEIL